MYFILLFAAAFLIISLLTSFWPVKLYHHYLLKDLAAALDSDPQRQGLVFSKVYSEITPSFQGREWRIRFVEGSADSLKSNTGLELRLKANSGTVLECYPLRRGKREWGDFKRFLTGNPEVDGAWFMLSNNLETAAEFWGDGKLAGILNNRKFFIEQLSFTQEEVVARLRRYPSKERVVEFMETLANVI
ncbi:MAG TPA: hypothetical protein VHY08_21565 [Bacillota bacterium]|nr:hypothetical protein [Bacillota bacterium]